MRLRWRARFPSLPPPPRLASYAVGLVAILTLGASQAAFEPPGATPSTGAARRDSSPSPAFLCPPSTLPDDGTCIHLPDGDELPAALDVANAHRDREGRWAVYDQIPRRPDRPADYNAYSYPVACDGCVVSGYDLDRADEAQRRSPRLRHVGHGAVDLAAPRGTPVTLVPLEHQQGSAEVVYAGALVGTSVVTLHSLREAGELRDYIVILGHLDALAPGLADMATPAMLPLHDGQLLGFVGDSGSPGLVHLHLEVRRVRTGVDVRKLAPSALLDGSNTVVCDPRNVLLLK